MPLVHYANGPLSATGPIHDIQLDQMEIDESHNHNEIKIEFSELDFKMEEKADPR